MTSDTLILVHTIFRHGERTADHELMYSNDPYRNEEFFPYGPGYLTNNGKNQMYDLGKKLRNRYDEYLGGLYLPKYVDARASVFARAQISLQLVLASLFKPTGNTIWKNDLNWQPIASKEEEFLTAVFSEEFLKFYKQYFENEGKDILKGHEDLIKYLSTHTGDDFKTTRDIWFLYATLSTELTSGVKLPGWTDSIFECTQKFAMQEYHIQTATKQLRKLIVGKLMYKILLDTKAKINGTSNYKIHLYSCHDNNVATALIFFGLLSSNFLPKYAACIVIEIHEINNKHVIKLLYSPSYADEFEYLTFSNGLNTMDFEDFANMVQDLVN